MKKAGFLLLIILVISVGSIIGFVGISSLQNNPWDGLSCEEMFEFAMSPEHQKLTMEQHMEFHKKYEPCLQKP